MLEAAQAYERGLGVSRPQPTPARRESSLRVAFQPDGDGVPATELLLAADSRTPSRPDDVARLRDRSRPAPRSGALRAHQLGREHRERARGQLPRDPPQRRARAARRRVRRGRAVAAGLHLRAPGEPARAAARPAADRRRAACSRRSTDHVPVARRAEHRAHAVQRRRQPRGHRDDAARQQGHWCARRRAGRDAQLPRAQRHPRHGLRCRGARGVPAPGGPGGPSRHSKSSPPPRT